MMNSISVDFGEGRYLIQGTAVLCGRDAVAAFSGGTKPHVGAVSLAVYEPERDSATVSTVTAYTHRDDLFAARCAKEMAAELKCTVTVSVGIHIDHASSEELEILTNNFDECYRRMVEAILNSN